MFLLGCVVASLMLARVLGGRPSALAFLELRAAWAIVAALALQVLVISVIPESTLPVHVPLHLLSYALAGYCVLANLRLPGIGLIGLGGLLNLVAIAANGGVMPASAGALAAAGLDRGAGFANSTVVDDAKVAFLGDVFALGGPFPNVFSVGDVLLGLGVAWLIVAVSRRGSSASGSPRESGVGEIG
jgi:hypothetical protein